MKNTNNRAQHIQELFESRSYSWKEIKKGKMPLTPEERKEVFARKAVWHMNGGSPSSAIWKTRLKDGTIRWGCNTHRATAIKKTLKGAIGSFPFIKSTS